MFRGPLFRLRTRIALRAYARSQGHSNADADDIADCCTDGVIEEALSKAPPSSVGALGDGAILKAILDFLKSPEGQQFIKFLFELIMGLLVV